MAAALLDLEGMLRARCAPASGMLGDATHVDGDGRLLVPLVDLLAMAQVGVDVDVVLVHLLDGSCPAFRMSEIVADDMFLHVVLPESDLAGGAWSVRLRTSTMTPTAPIASIEAMSFATFVGQS